MTGEGRHVSLSSVVVVAPEHVAVNVGEETLILHLETGGYFSLRNVAARIWELLQRPIVVSEVAEVLSREYDIPRERSEADLLELLPELARRGLLRVVTDGGTRPDPGAGSDPS